MTKKKNQYKPWKKLGLTKPQYFAINFLREAIRAGEASTAIDALGLMYEESGDMAIATGLFKAHAILVAEDPKAEFLEEAGTWADTLENRGI